MSASISLSCPSCKEQIKAPAAALGKRVKCKKCGEVFTAAGQANSAAGGPSKGGGPAKAKKVNKAIAKHMDEFDDDGNPYDVTTLDLTYRCPHCAGEMESDDAIVCLNCGYNTSTRQKRETVRLYKNTSSDWLVWLAPGIFCVLMLIPLGYVHAYLWLPYSKASTGLPVLELNYSAATTIGIEKEGAQVDGWLPARIWGSVISAAAMWFCIWFGFRRLVLHPKPPVRVKTK